MHLLPHLTPDIWTSFDLFLGSSFSYHYVRWSARYNSLLLSPSSLTSQCSTAGTDATGFLATDTSNDLIILSYRGSESIRNYLSDLNFALVPVSICNGCLGDAGFWSSWMETRDVVNAAIKALVAVHPTYKIIATGHSLGGAIATFAAADLRNQGYTVDLVSSFLHVGGKRNLTSATGQFWLTSSGRSENGSLHHQPRPWAELPINPSE